MHANSLQVKICKELSLLTYKGCLDEAEHHITNLFDIECRLTGGVFQYVDDDGDNESLIIHRDREIITYHSARNWGCFNMRFMMDKA